MSESSDPVLGGCGVLVYFGSGGVGIGGNRMLTCNVERVCRCGGGCVNWIELGWVEDNDDIGG